MKKSGIELIAEERQEQIEKHGYTVEKDVEINEFHQLKNAAIQLLGGFPFQDEDNGTPFKWDGDVWRKMFEKPKIERLIVAGALIAAEIDRLQAEEG